MRPLLVSLALWSGVVGCSPQSEPLPGPATSPATTDSLTASSAPPSSSAAGCSERNAAVPPAGAPSGQLGDLDNDGKVDQVYVWEREGGERVFTVVTAAGGVTEWSEGNTSGADPVAYGVANANEDGRPELFVRPGRAVFVLAMSDCDLEPYVNDEGHPYAFDLGALGTGTGVGCVDADGDGRRDLVGLLREQEEGDRVLWRRTIVRLEGDRAVNGTTDEGEYERPADRERIELLSDVSCGDQPWPAPVV